MGREGEKRHRERRVEAASQSISPPCLQVTQTTQPVPSAHHSDAPPPGPTLSQLPPEQKFEQLKAEGNEHVKKVWIN